jgi:hypothetical protein
MAVIGATLPHGQSTYNLVRGEIDLALALERICRV